MPVIYYHSLIASNATVPYLGGQALALWGYGTAPEWGGGRSIMAVNARQPKKPVKKAAPKKAAVTKKSPPKVSTNPVAPQKVTAKSKNPNKRGRLAILASIAVLALALAAFVASIGGDSSSTSSDTTASTVKKSSTTATAEVSTTKAEAPKPDPELIALLTVKSTTVDCVAQVKEAGTETKKLEDGSTVYGYEVGALKDVGVGPEFRYKPDSFQLPMVTEDPTEGREVVQTAICQDPLDGVAVAYFFANWVPFALESNPWLKPFVGDAEEINDWALAYMPLFNVENPSQALLDKAQAMNLKYQKLAEKLATLVARFSVHGEWEEWLSAMNLHLRPFERGAMAVGSLPEVEVNPTQENLKALILILDSKTGECWLIIGFNWFDLRPELFLCAPPAQPVCTENCGSGGTTTTTVPDGRKSNVTTTIATPTITPPGTTTTVPLPPGQTGGGGSGTGAPPPATTVAPKPTVAPPGSGATSTSSPPGSSTTVQGP